MGEENNIHEISSKILIVEDSPVQVEKLKYSLEKHGFQVMAANNGVQALEELKKGYRPFIIVSDIIMPEMDGYEFCKKVRENKDLEHIPVILLTILSEMKDIIRGLECGANGFIIKPFDEKNLISRIEQMRLNVGFREKTDSDSTIRTFFSGESYQITADKRQILEFLLSVYEDLYRNNRELVRLDRELLLLNEHLEERIEERTAALTQEISERKRAEEALRESEERYRELFEHISSCVAIYETVDDGADFVFKDFNDAGERTENIVRTQVIGKRVTEVFPGVTDLGLLNVLRRVWQTGEPAHHPVSFYQDQRIQGWRENYVYRLPSGEIVVVYDDITLRKQAEEALLDSERKYHLLVDSSIDAVLLTSPDGGIISANPAACQIFGYTEDEIRKLGRGGIVDNSDPNLPAALEERAKTGKFRGELTFVRKDDTKFPGDVSTAIFTDKEGRIRTSMVIRDITGQKHISEALRRSEERYRTIIENIEDGYYEVDLAGRLTFFNDAMARINGYSREETMGMSFRDHSDAENAEILYKDFNRVYQTGESSKGSHYEVISKNGEKKNLETSISLIRDSSNKPMGFRGIARDVTELRQAQNALQTSEERFRIAAESSNDFIYEWDLNTGQIDWFGDATERLNHLLSEIPVTATDFNKIIYLDDYTLFLEPIRRHLKRGVPYNEEFRIIGKEGRIIYVKVAGMGLRNQEGRVYKWIGAISDISERKKTEEELRKSFEKLRMAMNGIIQAMALTVETRDPYTAGHQQRVADLARAMAQEMDLAEDQVDALRMAGTVHDLGKIGIPAEILSKPVELSDIELKLIMNHPQISYNILKDIDFPWPVAQIVLQHHERINGSGYPLGLSGDDILLEARILTVADVVEAIASHRPYRPAHGIDIALEEIAINKGILYDQNAVNACLRLFNEKGYKFKEQVTWASI